MIRRDAIALLCILAAIAVTFLWRQIDARVPHCRVAIVGGGLSGAYTAYALRQLEPDCVIDLFEATERIGGRVRALDFEGAKVEAGASIFVPENRLIAEAVRQASMDTNGTIRERRKAESGASHRFALYDADQREFLFVQPNVNDSWLAWALGFERANTLTMLRRWGYAPLAAMQRDVAQRLSTFTSNAYQPAPFGSIDEFLARIDAAGLSFCSARAYFAPRWSPSLVDELVAAAVRVNYGQSVANISAFGALITIFAMSSDRLLAVHPSNDALVRYLVAKSGARVHFASRVDAVSRDASSGALRVRDDVYSHVALAVPLASSPIDLSAAAVDAAAMAHVNATLPRMHRTHATFVAARSVRRAFFVDDDGDDDAPHELDVDAVLAIESRSPVNSIDCVASSGSGCLYKVFSRRALSNDTIRRLFTADARLVAHFPWPAYPKLDARAPGAALPPILLAPRLFFVNAMESAVSTMETQALAALNVARLISAQIRS